MSAMITSFDFELLAGTFLLLLISCLVGGSFVPRNYTLITGILDASTYESTSACKRVHSSVRDLSHANFLFYLRDMLIHLRQDSMNRQTQQKLVQNLKKVRVSEKRERINISSLFLRRLLFVSSKKP